MIHTTLWLSLIKSSCKRLFWRCIVLWWPLLLRRDYYCSEAKTWPNVSTVSWDIYDPKPKFYLNMMRVITSLLSLRAGSLLWVQRKFLQAELPSHEETGAKELTFPWPILLVGWLLHCQRTHFFSAPSLRRMVALPPKIFSKLAQASLLAGYR